MIVIQSHIQLLSYKWFSYGLSHNITRVMSYTHIFSYCHTKNLVMALVTTMTRVMSYSHIFSYCHTKCLDMALVTTITRVLSYNHIFSHCHTKGVVI